MKVGADAGVDAEAMPTVGAGFGHNAGGVNAVGRASQQFKRIETFCRQEKRSCEWCRESR
jgi:hypothetical protein